MDVFLSLFMTFFVVGIDRMTKLFFSRILSHGESLPVIRHVFHMTLVRNTGIAFGFFKDRGVVFIIIPLIAVMLLIYNIHYYHKNPQAVSRGYMIAFSLILGGALGNLYDRIAYGYVIDFIDLRIWPVFNMADSAITIGAVMIAWTCLRPGRV
jgi:signal peptidase II